LHGREVLRIGERFAAIETIERRFLLLESSLLLVEPTGLRKDEEASPEKNKGCASG